MTLHSNKVARMSGTGDLHPIQTPERMSPESIALLELQQPSVSILFRRSRRAKRYILSVRGDRTVVVTLPRGGSRRDAEEFLNSRRDWVDRVLQKLPSSLPPKVWVPGTEILFRGLPTPIEEVVLGTERRIRLGNELFIVSCDVHSVNLRPYLEAVLRQLAELELPPRVAELAQQHACPVRRVLVRNQRSRWGSCSSRGTVSLNWRLIQSPPAVRDYIIIHELMHLREMNHSSRFWAHVAAAFPAYQSAEQWLSEHRYLL